MSDTQALPPILRPAVRALKKGDVVSAVQVRAIKGTPEGTRFDLRVLGWMGGVVDFRRVDTDQLIPWGAISRGLVAIEA